ncbi:hypothetical protein YC2023_107939 [Brassica napus]
MAEGTSAWVSQIIVPPSSRGYGTEADLPCVTACAEEKKLTRIPLVMASEPGRAQLENRTSSAFEL